MYLNSSLNKARSSWKKQPVAGQLGERPGQNSGPPPNCPPYGGPWDRELWGIVVVWPPLISAETLPGPLPCSRCAQMVGLICCSFSPDTHTSSAHSVLSSPAGKVDVSPSAFHQVGHVGVPSVVSPQPSLLDTLHPFLIYSCGAIHFSQRWSFAPSCAFSLLFSGGFRKKGPGTSSS